MERAFLNVWWCREHNFARTEGPFECPVCKAVTAAAEKLKAIEAAPPATATGSGDPSGCQVAEHADAAKEAPERLR